MIPTVIQVALGGAIGASLRYGANVGIGRLLGAAFPWHTLAVNVIGSALMGGLMVLSAHRGQLQLAPFLMTGILGGFTTFSAFSMDTISLAQRGETALAAGYVVASVLFSLAAFVCAAAVTRSLI
ncbi:putative fluoride ion transporter CrcB [Gemmobacter aquaticus]|jgi:CrcB protein|uniref:Fluoride-specific ion channel FluC n=1 Tax=Gemmobacter aquaticus TaxID=490185 RepID=A0A917YL48_9RHOB|nr:fluoride efflux transporter CrcB [Gemmobacter aquaticus]GGO35506.1 putative fluoride ion transporter CrcB [Gemmobacter aquaticus]